jgi:hypothetical protein
VLHAKEALSRIEAAGGCLISAEDGFDSSTPMGKFATTMIFAIAELELERVRDSWSTARAFAARRGAHMAIAPVGYEHGEDGCLVPNADSPSVTEAFRICAKGANWTEIGRFLDARGVVPRGRKQSGRWAPSSVKVMLRNRVYLGEIRAGDFVNTDAHPPLVSLTEFEAAQVAPGTTTAGSTQPALLSGLLRCASCRHCMKPKRIDGARVYRCNKSHSSGVCPAPATIYASVVEPFAESLLLDQLAARSYAPERLSAEVEAAERDVARYDAELRAWVTDEEIAATISREMYLEGLQARQQRADAATARRRALFSRTASDLPDRLEFGNVWPTFTEIEKRRVFVAAFDAIAVRPNGRRPVAERVVAIARGDGPDDLPGRGKRVPFGPFDLDAISACRV